MTYYSALVSAHFDYPLLCSKPSPKPQVSCNSHFIISHNHNPVGWPDSARLAVARPAVMGDLGWVQMFKMTYLSGTFPGTATRLSSVG